MNKLKKDCKTCLPRKVGNFLTQHIDKHNNLWYYNITARGRRSTIIPHGIHKLNNWDVILWYSNIFLWLIQAIKIPVIQKNRFLIEPNRNFNWLQIGRVTSPIQQNSHRTLTNKYFVIQVILRATSLPTWGLPLAVISAYIVGYRAISA